MTDTPHSSTTPGGPVDDRRDDPPAPASAQQEGGAPADERPTESQREVQETVRSISRLEESN